MNPLSLQDVIFVLLVVAAGVISLAALLGFVHLWG